MREEQLSAVLLRILGPAGLVALADAHGGTRCYIRADGASLVETIGGDAAQQLAARYGGFYIRVPLARELRARHYRAAGRSNAEIARKLGMSETGVDRLFNAMPNKPVKGSGDPRQGDLFSSQ